MIGCPLCSAMKTLHEQRERDPIPPELRGWSWDRPPVKPRAKLGLAVSDIAYGYWCGWRDLWYKKKYGIAPEPGLPAQQGREVHKAFRQAIYDVNSLSLNGRPWDIGRLLSTAENRFSGEVAQLYKQFLVIFAGEATVSAATRGSTGAGPRWLAEYKINGWHLGLSSQLRVDAVGSAGVVVEVKSGKRGRWQEISTTGYALSLESSTKVPVDYGVLVNVNLQNGITVTVDPIYISPDLRREFLKARDEAIDALLSDKEPPPGNCGEEGRSPTG
ncbi:MAG: type I-A CRISPR-associated protein Cas4/Csa1 [Acidilobaceae archaeon]|nr:type I-A CRISPR-associated protein Cas4/Csa1 [Acidilobaceae archaeon]MCX8166151.1 type I-A CRISPR-associated protein Cas4/Csa1 [Acidilobaceae archaeon]